MTANNNYTTVDIQEAKAAWEKMDKPNYSRMVRLFAQAGKKVSVNTIRAWHRQNWTLKDPQKSRNGEAAVRRSRSMIDESVMPVVTGTAMFRVSDLDGLFSKLEGTAAEFNIFESALGPLAKRVAALDDAQLLIEAHRGVLRACTLAAQQMLLNQDLFTIHPEAMTNALKSLAVSVETTTGSLRSATLSIVDQPVPLSPVKAAKAAAKAAAAATAAPGPLRSDLPMVVVEHLDDVLKRWSTVPEPPAPVPQG